MNRLIRRARALLSIFLSFALAFSLNPISAYAAAGDSAAQAASTSSAQSADETSSSQQPSDAVDETPGATTGATSGAAADAPLATQSNDLLANDTNDTTVCQIGGTGYETLAEAFAAVTAGQTATIQMLKDTSISSQISVNSEADVTLDLNGKTVSVATAEYAFYVEHSSLTVTDTTESEGAITATGKSGIVFLHTKGTFVLKAGKLTTADAYVVYTNGGDEQNFATLKVEGGAVSTSSNMAIRSDFYTQITISGGSFTGLYYCVFDNTLDGSLRVSGGTFTSTAEDAENELVSNSSAGFVTGGTFAHKVDSNDVAENYACAHSGDAYAVVSNEQVAAEVDGTEYYVSLAEAFNSITGNDHQVALCNNTTVTEQITLADNASINFYLQGYTITANLENPSDALFSLQSHIYVRDESDTPGTISANCTIFKLIGTSYHDLQIFDGTFTTTGSTAIDVAEDASYVYLSVGGINNDRVSINAADTGVLVAQPAHVSIGENASITAASPVVVTTTDTENTTLSVSSGNFYATNGTSDFTVPETLTGFVSGGTFTYDVPSAQLGRGYVSTLDQDTQRYVVSEKIVCTIDGEEKTWSEALEFIEEEGSANIVMIADADIGSNTYLNGDVTLDLAGHAIITSSEFVMDSRKTFTIEDSSEEKTGAITLEGEDTGTLFDVLSAETLVIKGGTFTSPNSSVVQMAAESSDATVKIEGGTFKLTGESGSVFNVLGFANLSISGGEFTGNRILYTDEEGASFTFDITGGTFTGSDKELETTETGFVKGGLWKHDPTAFVADGYLVLQRESGYYEVVDKASMAASITRGGTTDYYETLEAAIDSLTDGDTIDIMNPVTLDSAVTIGSDDITIDFHGNQITSNSTTSALVANYALALTDSSSSAGGIVCAGGTGVTVGDNATLIIEKATVEAAQAVSASATATVKVRSGSLTSGSAATQDIAAAEGATVKVSGGVFSKAVPQAQCADGYVPCKNGSSYGVTEGYVVTFNGNGGTLVSSSTQTVLAGNTATEPKDPQNPGYLFNGWFTAATGGELFDFTKEISANTTLYAQWTQNPVAQVTDTKGETVSYVSLKDAFADVEDGSVLKLLHDVTVTETIAVKATGAAVGSAGVTLNLNGYKLKNESGAALCVGKDVDFTVIDKSDNETGVIEGNPHAIEVTGGYFTLESGTISGLETGEGAGISMSGADSCYVAIEGGTVTGATAIVDTNTESSTWLSIEDGKIDAKVSNPDVTSARERFVFGGKLTHEIPAKQCRTGYRSAKFDDYYTVIAISYVVKFNLNYTTTEQAPATQYLDYGEYVGRPDDPTRDGYTFAGWTTDAEGTQPFNFAEGVTTENLTLYAQWTAVPVTPVARVTSAEGVVTEYATLDAAFAALQDGGTLKITSEDATVLVANTLTITKTNVTIDFNGHQVSPAGEKPTFTVLDVKGVVTLTDSSTIDDISGGLVSMYGTPVEVSGDFPILAVENVGIIGMQAIDVTSAGAYVNVTKGDLDSSLGGSAVIQDIKVVEGASVKVSGGQFSLPVPQEQCAAGYIPCILSQTSLKTTYGVASGYIVTFDAGEGALSSASTQAVFAGACAIQPKDPIYKGHTFAGWTTDEAGTQAFDFTTPINATTTLYAQWTQNPVAQVTSAEGVTKTYTSLPDAFAAAADGSTIKLLQDMATDTPLTLPATKDLGITLNLNGHKLANDKGAVLDVKDGAILTITDKSDNEDGSITGSTNAIVVGDKGLVSVQGGKIYGNPDGDAAAILVSGDSGYLGVHGGYITGGYAISVTNKNAVVYINGGTIDGNDQDKDINSVVGGFVYGGTFTHEIPAAQCAEGYESVGFGSGYTVAPITITVTFDLNGAGGTVPAAQILGYGEYVGRPADPTREGYAFAGWTTDKEGKNAFDFAQGVKQSTNITLYAQWTQYVAEITDLEGTTVRAQYTSLQDAFDAVSQDDVIVLKANLTLDKAITVTRSVNFDFDPHGYSITCTGGPVFEVATNPLHGDFAIMDKSGTNTTKFTGTSAAMVITTGTVLCYAGEWSATDAGSNAIEVNGTDQSEVTYASFEFYNGRILGGDGNGVNLTGNGSSFVGYFQGVVSGKYAVYSETSTSSKGAVVLIDNCYAQFEATDAAAQSDIYIADGGAIHSVENGYFKHPIPESQLAQGFISKTVTEGSLAGWYYPELQQFGVTFHGNGGTFEGGDESVYKIYTMDSFIGTAPEVTREDYTLTGWALDAEGTQPYDLSTPITAETSIYAQWAAVPVAPVAQVTNAEGIVKTYTSLKDAFAAATGGSTIKLLSNVSLAETLSAPKVGKDEGTVILSLNGCSIDARDSNVAAISVGEGADLTVIDKSDNESGVIEGNPCAVEVTGGMFTLQSGMIFGQQFGDNGAGISMSGDARCYVSIEGGMVTGATAIVDTNTESTSWLIIQGGYIDADDNTQDITSVRDHFVYDGKFTHEIPADQCRRGYQSTQISTYYTVTQITYTVWFDLNYTTSEKAPATQYLYYNECVGRPADPVREGYTFAGWTTDKEGKSAYDFTQGVTLGSFTLYAQWTAVAGQVALPSVETGLVYNGSPQTGVNVAKDALYTVSGSSATNAGEHTATLSLKDKSKYVWASTGRSDDVTVMWTIAPKPVTIVPADATMTAGATLPALTGTIDGLVAAGDLGTITYTPVAGSDTTKAGSYKITAAYTPNANYDVTVTEGTLTVTEAPAPVVDKKGLTDAIAAAGASESGIQISADGTDVLTTDKWVTKDVRDALDAAIAAAQKVADDTSATQADVDKAAKAVKDAQAVFEAAEKYGSKEEPMKKIVRLAGDATTGEAENTAVAIAQEAFAATDYVIIANDRDFMDSMSATGLAGALNAPILLVNAKTGLYADVADEIRSLGATHAYIIGGVNAVTTNVESQLEALGVTSERIAGWEAPDTSVLCANKIAEITGSTSYAIVARSDNFQDALSMSSFAYKYKAAIVLAPSAEGSAATELPEGGLAILNAATNGVFVAGGAGAITDDVLAGCTKSATRLWGEDGFDTSNQIATYMVANGLLTADVVTVANGAVAAKGLDALAGSALAGTKGGVVLLANGSDHTDVLGEKDYTTINEGKDSQGTESYLAAHASGVQEAYLLGGTYVAPETFEAEIALVLGFE